MKPKAINKTLRLNKKTIVNLSDQALEHLRGGIGDEGNFVHPKVTVAQPTCATYTGNLQSDPCCITC